MRKKIDETNKSANEDSLSVAVTKELDELWTMVREKEQGADILEDECKNKISWSFEKILENYPEEQIDKAYVWPKYVKLAVNSVSDPIEILVNYVNENNYKRLTKCLDSLNSSLCRNDGSRVKKSMDKFSEAVYLHILTDINSNDIPSCLELGRIAQRNGEYSDARKWFTRIVESEQPFNGVTALLACYESETKHYLSKCQGDLYSDSNQSAREMVKILNNLQYDVYEKWRRIMEEHISKTDSVTDQYKREYVALMTGFARFERSRRNYAKAFDILERIPEDYPDIYRVYAEQAMIYQKPYQNCYYSLEKSIEAFRKAEKMIDDMDSSSYISVKGRKSILMPLANTYFKSGRYNEAKKVCDSVLGIDKNEQRAINLKNLINSMAG